MLDIAKCINVIFVKFAQMLKNCKINIIFTSSFISFLSTHRVRYTLVNQKKNRERAYFPKREYRGDLTHRENHPRNEDVTAPATSDIKTNISCPAILLKVVRAPFRLRSRSRYKKEKKKKMKKKKKKKLYSFSNKACTALYEATRGAIISEALEIPPREKRRSTARI